MAMRFKTYNYMGLDRDRLVWNVGCDIEIIVENWIGEVGVIWWYFIDLYRYANIEGGVWFIMIIPHGKKAPENVHGSSLEIVIRPLT